jgi:serine/threonine-protein kinase
MYDERECLDDETLAALFERRIDRDTAGRIHKHIDRCMDCRNLVADLALEEPASCREDDPIAEEATHGPFSTATAGQNGPGEAWEGGALPPRYRPVRRLDRGAMGRVWLAHDVVEGRDVAIKIIDAELANVPQARARFQREANIARRLRHPNVVQMLDEGVMSDGQPFIAMELLIGKTLRGWLAERQRLSLEETAWLVDEVCKGLAEAHRMGLVHRDLKPENIFVTDGSPTGAKVLDFGLAKVTDLLADASVDPTRTGAMLGTPTYMSPEQAQGKKDVDHRTDLWAVGVVAFECLTGHRPFVAKALGKLIGKILAGPIARPSQVAPEAGLPASIDAWMGRALQRDKASRFRSADELAREFLVAAGVTG